VLSRQDVHRLVDEVPEARLPVLEQVLRASLGESVPPEARSLVCDPDLDPDLEWADPIERVRFAH